MPSQPLTRLPSSVKQTLRWLVPEAVLADPASASGEARAILRDARRLHESLRRLPRCFGQGRCLVVGSIGVEVPYLAGKLGWGQIACVSTSSTPGVMARQATRLGGDGQAYTFQLMESELDGRSLPVDDGRFDLVVFWGGLERLRRDPELALYELNRAVSPRARLSLVTENPISLQATHSLLRGLPTPTLLGDAPQLVPARRYAPWEILDLLRGTGWHVDALTSIVPEAAVPCGPLKRVIFKRWVNHLRRDFGLDECYWNAHLLAEATKAHGPTRRYPTWLYQDEQIRRLKASMMERLSAASHSAA